MAEIPEALQALPDRLRAFSRDCVTHGDMTPGAARMLQKIADEIEGAVSDD